MSSQAAASPLARVALGDGEARLFDSVVTERILEVELGGCIYRTPWDPRETGTVLFADPTSWSSPSGQAIDRAQRERVLDGLWALAPATRGIDAILFRPSGGDGLAVARWSRGADGHMVQVSEAIDVLELGQTVRLRYRPVQRAAGKPTALVDLASAHRIFPAAPAPRPLDPEERSRIARRLECTTRNDYVLTDYPWRFELEDRAASAPLPR